MSVGGAWLRQVLLLLGALVLDDKLTPQLTLFGARPDLVVPALLVTTLRFGPRAGTWAGFTCGLFIDVATPENLGARALALAVGAFVTGRMASHVDVRSLPVQVVLIGLLGVVNGAIYQAASHVTDPGGGFTLFFTRELPTVVYTMLLMVPLLMFLGRRLVPLRASWREST